MYVTAGSTEHKLDPLMIMVAYYLPCCGWCVGAGTGNEYRYRINGSIEFIQQISSPQYFSLEHLYPNGKDLMGKETKACLSEIYSINCSRNFVHLLETCTAVAVRCKHTTKGTIILPFPQHIPA